MYIGKSIDIESRWDQHLTDLRNNTHHSWKLQNDFNEFGEENFEFDILELFDKNLTSFQYNYHAYQEEFKFMMYFNTLDDGYNIENTLKEIADFTKTLHIFHLQNILKGIYEYLMKILSGEFIKDCSPVEYILENKSKFTSKHMYRLLTESTILPIVYPYSLFEKWIIENDLRHVKRIMHSIEKTSSEIHKSKIIDKIQNNELPEIKFPIFLKP